MWENIKFEPPFYTAEAYERFLQPLLGSRFSEAIDPRVLENVCVLTAANAALRFSIEHNNDSRSQSLV
jgi:hypothetical protein